MRVALITGSAGLFGSEAAENLCNGITSRKTATAITSGG
jgi:hypothetical protein